MTIVPASMLSRAEMHMLGANVVAAVRREQPRSTAPNPSPGVPAGSVDERAAPLAVTGAQSHQAVA